MLIANVEIASGRLESPTINDTGTEADFVRDLERTVEKSPQAGGWWFIVDQLNTHKSASLVRLVAEKEGIKETELGEKGKSGILKSMKTRQEFLEEAAHRIRIIYTPKHWRVVKSNRNMVFNLVKEVNQVGEFQIKRRLKGPIRKVSRVF